MALLVAISTCGVLSIFGFPFRHYQSWYSWSPLTTNGLLALYAALGACGGGGLGWGLAALAHAEPTQLPALNGVLFGLGGMVTLCADWKPEKFATNALKGMPTGAQLRDASTILAKAVGWIAAALDESAHRRMLVWLRSLPDADLMEVGWLVHAEVESRPGTTVAARRQLLAGLVPQMERLASRQELSAARAHLASFCATYFVQQHCPKPAGHELRPAEVRVGG